MITVDTQVSGLAETIAALQALRSTDALYEAQDQAIEVLHEAARDYPPELPNQRYVRTEWLKTGWGQPTISQSGDTLTARITNTVRYAQFVQGDGTQARIHQGRWETVGQIADRLEDRVVGIIEAGADAWLAGAGF